MKCEFEMRTTAGYILRVTREQKETAASASATAHPGGKVFHYENWLQVTGPQRHEVSVLMSDEELRRLQTSIEAVLL